MSAVALQSFGFGDQLVRVVDRDGGVWFVANDVCAALQIKNSRDAIGKLDADEKDGVGLTDTIGRLQQMTIVNEGGVFTLALRCRDAMKPGTIPHRFRKWVTGEVLPAIRRTGRYEAPKPANDKRLDFDGALGTADERDTMRVAILIVKEYRHLYGERAGRAMMQKLGFPVPGVDLEPAPEPMPAGGFKVVRQVEGDLYLWSQAAKLKESRREATHLKELYDSYVKWCSATGAAPMMADKFRKAMVMLFNHEEHPEMICVVMGR